ncbi:MAG TPA: cation:proton antiporter, partial [Longimicrobiales bacterium]|nr:cation:proton antiporter [Longimicrobiales bacterium]
ELFSELGIALLLFVVGLELSLEKIRVVGRVAVVTGLVQVALTLAAGFGLARLLGFDAPAALIVGLVTAFSSTVVVVKLLDRADDLDRLHGRLAVGVLLVQDVLVAVVLTLLGPLAEGPGGGASVPAAVGGALAGIAGLALVGGALGRWLLPPFLRWLRGPPETLFVVALTWVFGFILAAEALHVSVEMGAFVAGVVLAQLPHSDQLRRRTHPLVDFFLAVFFVALGAGMDPAAMAASWPRAVAVAVFVLVGKPLVVAVLVGLQGTSTRVSFLAGLTLGQISEFAFILAGLAAGVGLVGPDFYGFVGLVGLLTISASTVLVPLGPALLGGLERTGLLRLLPGSDAGEAPPEPALREHVVIVGMNTLGRMLVERFAARGERVLAVDTDGAKLRGLAVATLAGDISATSVQEDAGLAQARLVVSALQIEDANSLLAFRCRALGVPVSIHAFDPSLVEELLELGADHLMVSKQDGIGDMEEGLRALGVLGG